MRPISRTLRRRPVRAAAPLNPVVSLFVGATKVMHPRQSLAALIVLAALSPGWGASAQTRIDRHGDPLPSGVIARLGTIRLRHGSPIRSLVFSPDGKTIASLGEERSTYLWDVATGRERAHLAGRFHALAFLNDGRTLATASPQGVLALWDDRGRKIRTVRRKTEGFVCAALSTDGKRLAAAIPGRGIVIWDTDNGRELHRLIDHTDNVVSLMFAADGRTLACGEPGPYGGVIRVWDMIATDKPRQILKHDSLLLLHALAPDGKTLATSLCDLVLATQGRNEQSLWSVTKDKEILKLAKISGTVSGAAFSSDGQFLAIGFPTTASYGPFTGEVRVWRVATGKELWRLSPLGIRPAVAFSPDGKLLATGGTDGTIRLFETASGKELPTKREGHIASVSSLAFAADDKKLVTGGRDDSVRFWDANTGRPLNCSILAEGRLEHLTCSPDGRIVAAAVMGTLTPLLLWDSRSGKEIRRSASLPFAASVAFAPDGKTFAVGGRNKQLEICETASGLCVRSLACKYRVPEPPQELIDLPVFSPDGKRVAAVSMGYGRLFWWDCADGRQLPPIAGPSKGLTSPAFSPDGKTLAARFTTRDMNGKHSLLRWEVEIGRQRPLAWKGVEDVSAFAFAPGGELLAIAEKPHHLRLWDVVTGTELRRLEGHRGPIHCLAFSTDGRTLVSGGDDTTALIWDLSDLDFASKRRLVDLSLRQLDARWADLGGEDAARAGESIGALIVGRQTVVFLKERLHPAVAPEARRVTRLLADLDSADFPMRERATRELEKLGETVVPSLRRALVDRPTLEVRRRIEGILARQPIVNLRPLRAIEVLEHIGDRESRQVLQTLAEGMPEARLTREAKASLKRWDKRRP